MDSSCISPSRSASSAFQGLSAEHHHPLATLVAAASQREANDVEEQQRRSSGGSSGDLQNTFSYEGRVRVLAGDTATSLFEPPPQQRHQESPPPNGETGSSRQGNGISLSLSLSSTSASSPMERSSPLTEKGRLDVTEEDKDDELDETDSLERLKQICGRSLDASGSSTPTAMTVSTPTTTSQQQQQAVVSPNMVEQVMQLGPFICHLCTFTSDSRKDFNLHVNSHYMFRCVKCDYETKEEEEYCVHLKVAHQTTPREIEDERQEGVRVPRVNSQGKVKTHKCKQCDFVGVTKEEFWIHARSHIKPEKRLHCPKCLFVTDLKHHLEYHLRNHYGDKPHKCPECNYSCVNKSMLSSHLKSHMTLYQYRCKDCTYVTKYCHSLKLHLRKYRHEPAMVLNLDGTPNPLPIIDVYGTRRGPKMKKDETAEALKAALAAARSDRPAPTATSSTVKEKTKQSRKSKASEEIIKPTPLRSPAAFPLALSALPEPPNPLKQELPLQHHQPPPSPQMPIFPTSEINQFKCELCDFQTFAKDIFVNHMAFHNKPSTSPEEAANRSLHSQRSASEPDSASNLLGSRNGPGTSPNAPLPLHSLPMEAPPSLLSQEFDQAQYFDYFRLLLQKLSGTGGSSLAGAGGPPPMPVVPDLKSSLPSHHHHSLAASPLQPSALLSRLYLENMAKKLSEQGSSGGGSLGGSKHSDDSDENDINSEPKPLEEEEDPDEERLQDSASRPATAPEHDVSSKRKRKLEALDNEPLLRGSKLSGAYVCDFCDMAFMDDVMYDLHKGYHGYEDPFQCNMCGEKLKDKVSFFMHVARKPH